MSVGDDIPINPAAQQPRMPSQSGDVTWEAAVLLPKQGRWSEADFFKFHTNRMVELNDGFLEILPMPTWLHQLIVRYFMRQLENHLQTNRIPGEVLMAVLPVRLFERTVREPDLLYCSPENIPRPPEKYPQKMDLALEVVSGGEEARRRDYQDKRDDYAKAGVKEYWIVDPQDQQITVLHLDGSQYQEVGVFGPSQQAVGRLLPGFSIDTAAVFDLGRES